MFFRANLILEIQKMCKKWRLTFEKMKAGVIFTMQIAFYSKYTLCIALNSMIILLVDWYLYVFHIIICSGISKDDHVLPKTVPKHTRNSKTYLSESILESRVIFRVKLLHHISEAYFKNHDGFPFLKILTTLA